MPALLSDSRRHFPGERRVQCGPCSELPTSAQVASPHTDKNHLLAKVSSLSCGSVKAAESLVHSALLTKHIPNRPFGGICGIRLWKEVWCQCVVQSSELVQEDLVQVGNSKIHRQQLYCFFFAFLSCWLSWAPCSWKFTRLTGSSFHLLWYRCKATMINGVFYLGEVNFCS